MSVAIVTPIVPRMWRGYDDPGLPESTYIAYAVSLGDGSGGTNSIEFLFKDEGIPASGRFYNIEQINVFTTQIVTAAAHLQIRNFEQLGPFLIGAREFRFEIQPSSNSVSCINFNEGFPPLPLFLGQSSRFIGTNSLVEVGTDNTAVVILSANIQGFVWGPRSIMAEGGLRRPLDALYGR